MNETNRTAIVVLAALVILAMAVLVFIAWAEPDGTIERLGDFVSYLNDHNDNAAKLILTLGALTVVILAVLVIVLELAPEHEAAELKLEEAGGTTVVSAEGLRQRLEDLLLAIPVVTAAKVSVSGRNKGVAASLDLTVLPQTNVGVLSQEAIRVVTQALQEGMGLSLSEAPRLRITFAKASAAGEVAPGPSVGDQQP